MHTNLEIKTKTHCKGGGGQKSEFSIADRVAGASLNYAKFQKLFLFVSRNDQTKIAGESDSIDDLRMAPACTPGPTRIGIFKLSMNGV
jgi:hypothetical protein